ncbi:MAG: HAD family hydrolase [Bacteroidia bacterium]
MKLFLTDLDGTLLNHQGTLSDSGRTRLKQLLESGLPFSIATARGWPGAKRALGELDIRLPIIVRNGAFIVDYASGDILAGNLMGASLAREVVDFFRTKNTTPAIAVFQDGKESMYGEPPENRCMETYAKMRAHYGSPSWTEVPSLEPYLEHPVAQFNVIDEGSTILHFRDMLAEAFGEKVQLHTYENILKPGWRMLSILSAEATKGVAARWLLDHMTLPVQSLTAFGDNYNDMSMLEIAGKAVAVGNAQPAIQRLAHTVLRYGVEDEVINYMEEVWEEA